MWDLRSLFWYTPIRLAAVINACSMSACGGILLWANTLKDINLRSVAYDIQSGMVGVVWVVEN